MVAARRSGDAPLLVAVRNKAGAKLTGKVRGRYLFGGPMTKQSVSWTYSKLEQQDVPSAAGC